MEFSTLSKVTIKCSNEIFLSLSLVYHPLQAITGSRKHLDNDEKVKLWTCLATPGLPSEVKSGPALSVSLKSVSSVSLTVPPGCRQEEGFLEKGRLLPREVREWRKGKPSLFTSSSSSIINHPLPPLFTSFITFPPLTHSSSAQWCRSMPHSWLSTDWDTSARSRRTRPKGKI